MQISEWYHIIVVVSKVTVQLRNIWMGVGSASNELQHLVFHSSEFPLIS